MMIVNAISVYVNLPEKIRAMPSRNIQMLIITPNQNVKIGAAAEVPSADPLTTSKSARTGGMTWMTCRMKVLLTMPTHRRETINIPSETATIRDGGPDARPRRAASAMPATIDAAK